ncbi:MAG: thiamine phosphate synthase [Acetobacter sp.]|uniref:thiamine phosphate synthase n=1 Tax=Acetobacter sp. TaxID=440 RepID=UPI0039EBBEB4
MPELYLVTPPLADAGTFLPVLERGLDRHQPAALLLRLAGGMTDTAALGVVTAIGAAVQHRGIALILEDSPALARQAGCDGVHLSRAYTALSVRDVRRMLGDDLQLGVAAGTSRDRAMQAGEDGADYVCFGPEPASTDQTHPDRDTTDAPPEDPQPVAALAQWWSVMMELPVVACAPTPEDAAQLATSTADFIMPSAQWWDNPPAWPAL